MTAKSTIKSVTSASGISWGAVLSFTVLFAFILYVAASGSLAKYKAYLL